MDVNTHTHIHIHTHTHNNRPQACNSIEKETLALVFSWEFCEIFKNIFFTEHLPGDCFYSVNLENIQGKIDAMESII